MVIRVHAFSRSAFTSPAADAKVPFFYTMSAGYHCMAAPVPAQAVNGAEPFERGQLEQAAFESMRLVHALGAGSDPPLLSRHRTMAKASIACRCDPSGKRAGRSSDSDLNS
jgi:hypothetical protein